MVELIPGNLYVLDADYANSSIVELVSFGNIYAEVKEPNTSETWRTMVNRLTNIKDNERY